MLAQTCLPLKFEAEQNATGLTAWAGLPVLLELMATLGLPAEVAEEVGLRDEQGWSDIQQVTALLLVKWAGGECVDDLEQLEADDGLSAIVERLEAHRLREDDRQAIAERFRRGGERTFPSPSAARKYLEDFEPDEPESKSEGEKGAKLPEPTDALEGLRQLVARPAQYAQLRPQGETTVTLDLDATIAESANRSAKPCYKGFRAYQPLNVFWFQRRQVLFSEFRDGNCPAAWRVGEVFEESLEHLPDDIDTLKVRSDTAGYQAEFLKAMAEGNYGDDEMGPVEFAVGVDITSSFKKSCLEVDEADWKSLEPGSRKEYAEVPFVPNWLGHTKRNLGIRFLAIREPLAQKSLPTVEQESDQQELPFPTMEFEADGYKIVGVVTNCTRDNPEAIQWYYQRCGLSEQAHGEWKVDLGGTPFPSADDFQANAAWWQLTLLAYNLEVLLQRDFWRSKTGPLRRMKRLRFQLICVPGRIVTHARQMVVKVPQDHPALARIREMRKLMGMFQRGPPAPWLKPAA